MKKLLLKLLGFVGVFSLLLAIEIPTAEAGILLRSSRITSRTRTRLPRIRVGYSIKPNTYAAARINPIGRAKTYGSADSMDSIIKAQRKHQQKLHKWQKKKLRAEAKLKQKKEREARLEERRRQRELQKKKKKTAKAQVQDKSTSAAGVTAGGSQDQPSRFGRPRDAEVGKPDRGRISFWSRFWQALIGKPKAEKS